MATPLNLEVGLSGSASSAAETALQAGIRDVIVTTGGGKQSQTLYIVVGVVALAIVLALLLFGRRRH